MKSSPREPELKTALQRMSDVAGPADLSDAALRGAKRVRRRRAVFTGLAAVTAVAALSLPFVVWDRPAADSPGHVAPQFAAPQPNLGECEQAPSVSTGTKEVAKEHWPQFVAAVLGLLPARDDYIVQNAYDLCNSGEADISNAYAVINLGRLREFGHLTVDLYVHETTKWVPNSCTELNTLVAGEQMSVLFCQDGTDSQPMLYGIDYTTANSITVAAVYADHRAVVMGRHDDAAVPAISADDLKLVVSHQDLLDLIPVAAEPLPTRSPEPPSAVAPPSSKP